MWKGAEFGIKSFCMGRRRGCTICSDDSSACQSPQQKSTCAGPAAPRGFPAAPSTCFQQPASLRRGCTDLGWPEWSPAFTSSYLFVYGYLNCPCKPVSVTEFHLFNVCQFRGSSVPARSQEAVAPDWGPVTVQRGAVKPAWTVKRLPGDDEKRPKRGYGLLDVKWWGQRGYWGGHGNPNHCQPAAVARGSIALLDGERMPP